MNRLSEYSDGGASFEYSYTTLEDVAYSGEVASPQALGRLLQQARLARGLSQREVAQELGISQAYVSELESGKTSLAMTRIFEFMRLTDMTLRAEVPEGRRGASP